MGRLIDDLAVEIYGPSCASIYAVYLKDLRERWANVQNEAIKNLVLFSDLPAPDLTRLVAQTSAPVVVTGDTFDILVLYLMSERQMDFLGAIRFAARAASILEECGNAANFLRIASEQYHYDLSSLVEKLISFYGVECGEAQFRSVMARLSADLDAPRPSLEDYVRFHYPQLAKAEARSAELTSDQSRTLVTLAHAYNNLMSGAEMSEVVWPLALFMQQEDPSQPPLSPFHLVGPARCLVFGPYMHLPLGHWRAEAQIEVHDCLSDNSLLADVYSRRILAHARISLPPAGTFVFGLDFEVADSFEPIELRLHLATGAIEGDLTLLHVRCIRVRPEH
jgi:hypothetical protein